MADVSLGGKKEPVGEQPQKMIYIPIPAAIVMIIELADSKQIQKYSAPFVKTIKKSTTNKELSKILCQIFGVKTARKFKATKPKEFQAMTILFGDIWGL